MLANQSDSNIVVTFSTQIAKNLATYILIKNCVLTIVTTWWSHYYFFEKQKKVLRMVGHNSILLPQKLPNWQFLSSWSRFFQS